MEEVIIYVSGIVYCSVCTNIKSRKRIEELVNQKNSTHIHSKWEISKHKKFRTGEPNPCPCERNPRTYRHFLLNC